MKDNVGMRGQFFFFHSTSGASAEQVHSAGFCVCQTPLKVDKTIFRMDIFSFVNETGGSCSTK